MKDISYKLFLAALLHDIGKFYLRTGIKTPSDFSLEGLVPESEKERYGYRHVAATAAFIQEQRAIFQAIREDGQIVFEDADFDLSKSDSFVSLAAKHHFPQSLNQAIIHYADIWSSGKVRNDDAALEKEEEALNALEPIFTKIKIKTHNKSESYICQHPNIGTKGIPLSTLKLDDTIIPVAGSINTAKEYEKLWEGFLQELPKLPNESFKGFSESLVYLLRKYTSSMPANSTDQAYISLYEHSKVTAALALASYQSQVKGEKAFQKINSQWEPSESEQSLQLYCCDLSGIQSFIYNISNRKAAMSLKGRSFYLQLVVDNIIDLILDECDAMPAQVVYSSGGKFYMILPNLPEVNETLDLIENKIVESIFEKHSTSLYACTGSVPFSFDKEGKVNSKWNEDIENLGDLWKNLADETSKKKSSKFKRFLTNPTFFSEFFGEDGKGLEPIPIGDQSHVCAVTGDYIEEHPPEDKRYFRAVELTDLDQADGEILSQPIYVKESVYQQNELGTELKDADFYMAFHAKELDKHLLPKKDFANKIFEAGGFQQWNHVTSLKESGQENSAFRRIASKRVYRVKRINSTDFTDFSKVKGAKCAYGYLFYGGNKQALLPEENPKAKRKRKTFHELVLNDLNLNGNPSTDTDGHKNVKEQKFKRLGILRMDVDGLGSIFINGIPDESKSFGAYATLSNQLDVFFSGYLNTIRNQDKYKDFVNILYSGGDDIFAVGRWDLLIEFAIDVRKKFDEFVGEWSKISISAGLVLVKEKYPISKAAKQAEEAEKDAKKFPDKKSPQKNAICLFGQVVSWDQEMDFVKEMKKKFIAWHQEDLLPKNTLNQIMRFWQMKNNCVQDWQWLSAYYFAKRKRVGGKLNEANKSIQEVLITGKISDLRCPIPRALDLITVAARWADFEIRNQK